MWVIGAVTERDGIKSINTIERIYGYSSTLQFMGHSMVTNWVNLATKKFPIFLKFFFVTVTSFCIIELSWKDTEEVFISNQVSHILQKKGAKF